MNISFFDDLWGLFSHFGQHSSLGSLSHLSEIERNPKMNISFFDDLGGLFHILVDVCCQNQNVTLTLNPTFSLEGGGVHQLTQI